MKQQTVNWIKSLLRGRINFIKLCRNSSAPTALYALFVTVFPALPGWANFFRAYGAGASQVPFIFDVAQVNSIEA
ncbi:MAG: hypothetical protein DMG65_26625 [Candidatus Angelobacter sp. Gp1-AA117]|nr:MAG: hypothetical protein DMG65_26625 [Candidatus Angelobacter sp. Gp1-AA117]